MKKSIKKTPATYTPCTEDYEFLSKLIVGIGEVAEITGIPQRQLRYWEQKGIIHCLAESSKNSTRRFNYSEIKRILLIKQLIEEGFTLEAASNKVEQRCKMLNAVLQKIKVKDKQHSE